MNIRLLLFLLLFPLASTGLAATQDLSGKWYQVAEDWSYQGQASLNPAALRETTGVSLTGGHFLHLADFTVSQTGRYVLDFKNTSTIAHFRQYVFDQENRLIITLEGGIASRADNPFFLRHGRETDLAAGQYRLISELSSPFFLAQPTPYLDTLAHYRDAVKPGNALTLIGLGVFLGLGIYYAALSMARRRMAEGMYALFILGNLLFNGTALLVFSDLFGLQSVYLASVPILISNITYIAFVMSLLELSRDRYPVMYMAGVSVFGLLAGFFLMGVLWPNWSLELARYGVGLFLTYGLFAGIVRARHGNVSARLYLLAIGVFFVLGLVTISLSQISGVYTLYIEHFGLFSVAVEVIMLALVLSYQFAQLHKEKESALEKLEHSTRMARTDILTGLANRFALELDLAILPDEGSLTFLDLDNLKYYNDKFGHERGDELLRAYARQLSVLLEDRARIYRVGGDEFAIISADGNEGMIEQAIAETTLRVQASGFDIAGASAGTAHHSEAGNMTELKHLADRRMYESKRKHKQSGMSGKDTKPV